MSRFQGWVAVALILCVGTLLHLEPMEQEQRRLSVLAVLLLGGYLLHLHEREIMYGQASHTAASGGKQ